MFCCRRFVVSKSATKPFFRRPRGMFSAFFFPNNKTFNTFFGRTRRAPRHNIFFRHLFLLSEMSTAETSVGGHRPPTHTNPQHSSSHTCHSRHSTTHSLRGERRSSLCRGVGKVQTTFGYVETLLIPNIWAPLVFLGSDFQQLLMFHDTC